MSLGLIVSFTGVIVAGLAGVLGVWMERGPDSSTRWALFFSGLIGIAMGVELVHTGYQNANDAATDAEMATLLLQLSELSAHNPELQEFVSAELAVQQRTNPEMVQKLEKQVAAKGGDPDAIGKMAADGRRRKRAAPAAAPAPVAMAAAAPEPEADEAPDKSPKAQAGAAAEQAAAQIANADQQAAKAMAAADAKAQAMVDEANKRAEAAAAKAAEAQKLADQKMKQATAKLAEAEKLMSKAQAAMKNVPSLPGGGGGGKGGGGKGGKGGPKIPGL